MKAIQNSICDSLITTLHKLQKFSRLFNLWRAQTNSDTYTLLSEKLFLFSQETGYLQANSVDRHTVWRVLKALVNQDWPSWQLLCLLSSLLCVQIRFMETLAVCRFLPKCTPVLIVGFRGSAAYFGKVTPHMDGTTLICIISLSQLNPKFVSLSFHKLFRCIIALISLVCLAYWCEHAPRHTVFVFTRYTLNTCM